ncbi:MAG: spore coat protein YlbD [Bacilli bacterium]|nr:spore coat protein YlbD [Bacilli bacterium]
MDKKEAFKEFVKENPRLLSFVKKGDMTWQKFYEIYDLYGDKDEAWKEYTETEDRSVEEPKEAEETEKKEPADIMTWLKNIDLDSVQSGVNSLQRVVGLLSDLAAPEAVKTATDTYKPRPLYKHFED